MAILFTSISRDVRIAPSSGEKNDSKYLRFQYTFNLNNILTEKDSGMCYDPDKLVRFDWAMKRLLRDKASFDVLEGFLTSLLGHEIKIERILESEGNKEAIDSKYNRVDILAVNDKDEQILIEVQNQSEDAYFHRMLFGTSKLVTEYLREGDPYHRIKKVYNINIIYFSVGDGSDYVYVGKTDFKGMHSHKELVVPKLWREKFNIEHVSDIYPEYYVLLADNFDRWSKTPLDQWMYFLSKGEIHEDASAPGLNAAREKLRLAALSREERMDYERHLDFLRSSRNQIETAFEEGEDKGRREGRAEGRAEGLEAGRAEERIALARKMKTAGMTDDVISQITGLSFGEF